MPLPVVTDSAEQRAAMARGADCRSCALYGCKQGPVPGIIRSKSLAIAIAQEPGVQEVERGEPLVGPSGQQFNAGVEAGGAVRSELSITNTLLCKPSVDLDLLLRRLKAEHKTKCEALLKTHADAVARAKAAKQPRPPRPPLPPLITPITCCAPRLKRDIEESGAPVVLTMGAHAFQAIADYHGIHVGKRRGVEVGGLAIPELSAQRGHPFVLPDGKILLPTYHPAGALKNDRHNLHVIRDEISRAMRIARRGYVDDFDPPFVIEPTIEDVERMAARFIELGLPVMVDIETDGLEYEARIRCVGLGVKRQIEGRTRYGIISIPFVRKNGARYWPNRATERRAALAAQSVLDHPAIELRGQNSPFDRRHLKRVGLHRATQKRWGNLAVVHHNTHENDCDHDLGFISGRARECWQWKFDVDHKGDEGTASTDLKLWTYNCKDVRNQIDAYEWASDLVDRYATHKQNAIDREKDWIGAEMTEVGLWVDEHMRRELSGLLHAKTGELRDELRKIVGAEFNSTRRNTKSDPDAREFNPNSFKQVGRWLYQIKGYTPLLNAQGKQIAEGEDPSTSAPALLALDDAGVDEETERFIDCFLMFKAYEKLRSSYVDGLPVRAVLDWREYEIGLLNPSWLVHVVPTGRFASSPNVQNWPALGLLNMRKMIVAPPGHVIVGADYDQVELRLYAVIAGDEYLLRAYQHGEDAHALNAATLFARTESEIRKIYETIYAWKKSKDPVLKAKAKKLRLIAKRFGFLKIYGGKRKKLYSVMRADRDKGTAERTFKDLTEDRVLMWDDRWQKWHGEPMDEWHRSVERFLAENGYVRERYSGRRRHFPDGCTQPNAPTNMEIQGHAAAMMDESMIEIAQKIPFGGWSKYSGICSQVHDWIGVCVPEGRAEEAKSIIERAMIKTWNGMKFTVESAISRTWAGQDDPAIDQRRF